MNRKGEGGEEEEEARSTRTLGDLERCEGTRARNLKTGRGLQSQASLLCLSRVSLPRRRKSGSVKTIKITRQVVKILRFAGVARARAALFARARFSAFLPSDVYNIVGNVWKFIPF